MGQIVSSLENAIRYVATDWTAKRIIVLFLLAVISEYILTDLQTTSLSVEGMKKMVESVDYSAGLVVPGIIEGTIWFEADHISDLVFSLGILTGISAALVLLQKKQYVRHVFILYNLFLLVWIVYNVILVVASLWSRQGVALLYLFDAALIWIFCVLSFGIFYWVVDAELQAVALRDTRITFNFLFPQTANRLTGWESWAPSLADYLFLAFTVSTSFGPTDTQVLSVKGKLLVICHATISLVIIVTIAAFAISNI